MSNFGLGSWIFIHSLSGNFALAFLKYFCQMYLYRSLVEDLQAPLYPLKLWNVSRHIIRQWPVTNNAVESWNKEYNAHFSGGGKPYRNKVIRHQLDDEESVRHVVIRFNLFLLIPSGNFFIGTMFCPRKTLCTFVEGN